MNIQDALAAIRQLDALPEARRRYLAVLAADARTDADRARILMTAKRENVEVRYATEQALKAEYAARAEWADRNPAVPVDAPQKPARARRWAEEGTTHDGPRPVSVTWGPITRTATQKQERKPLMGKNRVYPIGSVSQIEKEPKPRKQAPEHGLTAYNKNRCRCEVCRAAKSASRQKKDLRSPNGTTAPHGTISRYSNNRCRCDECRAAAAEYARGWRKRQRSH